MLRLTASSLFMVLLSICRTNIEKAYLDLYHTWQTFYAEDRQDDVFTRVGDDVAAIVIEPILGNCGSIASTQEYMQKLRDICDANGTLLIMDEVKTGFRVAKRR